MRLEKLNQWLTFVGHVGIVAGLLLVAVQMRQETELARLHVFSDMTTSRIDLHGAMLGENPAPVVMKSLTTPEDLTLEELRILDAYLLTAVNEARRRLVLGRAGLRVDSVEEENILLFYFGNRFAQAWWREFANEGEDMDNEVNSELDRIIRSAGNDDLTLAFFRALGERLDIRSTQGM